MIAKVLIIVKGLCIYTIVILRHEKRLRDHWS
jgi:hypothetical protein